MAGSRTAGVGRQFLEVLGGGVHGKRSGQNPSDQRFRGAVDDAVRDRGPQQVAPTFLDHDIGTGTVNRKIAHVGQVSDSRQRRQLRSRAEITGTKNRQPRGRQVVIVYRACLRFAAGSVALILQEQVPRPRRVGLDWINCSYILCAAPTGR